MYLSLLVYITIYVKKSACDNFVKIYKNFHGFQTTYL